MRIDALQQSEVTGDFCLRRRASFMLAMEVLTSINAPHNYLGLCLDAILGQPKEILGQPKERRLCHDSSMVWRDVAPVCVEQCGLRRGYGCGRNVRHDGDRAGGQNDAEECGVSVRAKGWPALRQLLTVSKAGVLRVC